MRCLISSALLCLCALGGTIQAQTLPKLSDLGLAPIATATSYCEEEDYSVFLEIAYEDGRVSKFHGQGSSSEGTSEATVQFNPLQMTIVSDDMPEVVYKDIVLNEAGCATSWTTYLGTQEFPCSATYNEKNQLIAMELEENESFTLTWTDDNLTRIEMCYGAGHNYRETFDLTYSSQPSYGVIVQAVGPGFDEFGFFPFSGLLGATSKNLPLQIVNRWGSDDYCDINDFDYEYDDQGRVTCVKITINGVHSDYRYYTFAQDSSHLNAIKCVGTLGTRKTTRGIVRTLPDGTQRIYDYLGR